MKFLFFLISLFFVFIKLHASTMPHNLFPKGRFIGFTKIDSSYSKVPTILDLYIIQGDANYKSLRGTLRFNLGDFNSSEYISFSFNEIKYSWNDQSIILNMDNKEVSINELIIKDDIVNGKVSFTSRDFELKMILTHEDKIDDTLELKNLLYPELPIFPSLNGEYHSYCKEQDKIIQIETSKWNSFQEESNHFLNGYIIKGRMAVNKNHFCQDGIAYCITSNITSALVDIFSNKVLLSGHPYSELCSFQDENRFICNDCEYIKVNSLHIQNKKEAKITINQLNDENLPELPNKEDLSGNYIGQLKFDDQNLLKGLTLRVKAYSYSDRPNRPELTYLDIKGKLSLDSDVCNEQNISIDFKNRRFLSTFPHLLIEGSHGFDFVIQKWTRKGIEGMAYSKHIGRIGPFIVIKDQKQLKPDTHLLPPLDGNYSSELWKLNMNYLGEMGGSMSDDLFPITISALFQIEGLSGQISSSDMSYDIFTSQLTFKMSDGRFFYLRPNSNVSFIGHIPSINKWGAILKRYSNTESFVKIDN